MSFVKNRKVLFPLLALAAGIVVSMLMMVARPQAVAVVHEAPEPLVRVVTVAKSDIPMFVRSQGRVTPLSEIDLVAEVTGKIVEIAPALAAGGYFSQGEVLARVDPYDYELALERARAEVAGAEVRVAMEEAEAEVAVREWKDLGGGTAAPPLVVRGPQLAQARAALAAARAGFAQASKDLDRTAVRAPFAGRVRSESVDVGQFVSRGVPLARVYSTDVAEIRLPLPDDDLAFLDLPLSWRDAETVGSGPEVTLHAEFAGRRWQWKGRIVRVEGQIDPQTHVIHVVARVDDPYGRSADGARPPLAAGMFVDADIAGRVATGVVAVPRAAMRGDSRVIVVDAGDRLRFRKVKVLRREADRVILLEGVQDGDRVCVSPLEVAVEDMKVRVAAAEAVEDAGSDSGRQRRAGEGA